MPYIDRIRNFNYTSPSGNSYLLQFDDLNRQGGKKVAIHEFPQSNAASVQDLGNQVLKISASIYFTGPDYDQAAGAFWKALEEKGPALLHHPRYGEIQVVPISYSQTENLVDRLGRADFSIEFVKDDTQGIFPLSTIADSEAVGTGVQDAVDQSGEIAAGNFAPVDAADLSKCKVQTQNWLDEYEKAFAQVAAVSEAVQAEINKAISEVNSTIDALLAAPLSLMTSLSNLAKLPAKIVTKVSNKISAYKTQIENTVLSIPESYSQAVSAVESVLYSFGWSSSASTTGTISNRAEAVGAAENMEEISGLVLNFIESTEAANPTFRANPETVQALVDAASIAKASLLERSFSLKAEHRVTLATERTPLDLLAEFYGVELDNLDESLDEFIVTNSLKGNEIILIPAGREVVYYG